MNFELLRLSIGAEDGWTAYLQQKQKRLKSIDDAKLRQRKKEISSSSASPATSAPSSPNNSPRRSPKVTRLLRDDIAVSAPRPVPVIRRPSAAEWHGESGYTSPSSTPHIPIASSAILFPTLQPRNTPSITNTPRKPSAPRASLTTANISSPHLFPLFESDVETPQPTPLVQRIPSSSSSDSFGLSDDDDDLPSSAAAMKNTTILSPPPTPSSALPVRSFPLPASEPASIADPDSDLSTSSSSGDERDRLVARSSSPPPPPDVPPYTDYNLNFDHILSEEDNPATIVDFVFVPFTLERMILFGVLLCLESFLFVLTALPLRCIIALYTLLRHHRLHYIQAVDLTKLSILLTCSLLLNTALDTASLRSWIGSQNYLKLHVFYTTLQLFDKLFVQYLSSVFAAMSWSISNIYRRRFALHWALAVACVTLHACCLIGNVLVLDLAIYGQANSLFTVIILLQFTEIKSGVLKKMKPDKLFLLCCADVIDRFYLTLFLVLVFVFNVDSYDWTALSHLHTTEWISSLLRSLAIIYASSIAVDWLKHMSIATFNGALSPHIYTQFAGRFLNSVTAPVSVSFFADKSRSLSQDLGLFPLALSVAVIKIVGDWIGADRRSFFLKMAVSAAIWICLFLLRLANHFFSNAYLRKFALFMDDPRVGILNKLLLIPPRHPGRKKVSITLGGVLSLVVPLYLLYLGYCVAKERTAWPFGLLYD